MSNVVTFPKPEEPVEASEELTRLVMNKVFEIVQDYNSMLNSNDHGEELVFMYESIKSAFLAAEDRPHILQHFARSIYQEDENDTD